MLVELMRVMIDALSIRKQKAGVGVYAYNLIDKLLDMTPAQSDQAMHFFILAQDDDLDFRYTGRSNVTTVFLPSWVFRIFPVRFLFEQFFLPWLLLSYRIDLLHSLHYSFPLARFGTKVVVTVHDMTSFLFPTYHTAIKVIYFRAFIRAAVAIADAIIFVSHSALLDCESLLGKPKGLSAVIYHGKGAEFRPDISQIALRRTRDKYNLPEHYILYIGTIEPRKNLSSLIKAFASLIGESSDTVLAIAGMKGWNNEYERLVALIQTLGIARRVLFLGFISEVDKPALLTAADIFVYPSVYEGFGLPVLEALASGVPTISSNISSIPEVAGNGALLIDPTSEIQMAEALKALLYDSPQREDLRKRAILQAEKFSWQQAAQSTYDVYLSIGRRHN